MMHNDPPHDRFPRAAFWNSIRSCSCPDYPLHKPIPSIITQSTQGKGAITTTDHKPGGYQWV